MNIELSGEQIEKIMHDELFESICDIERMISDNFQYHFVEERTFAPLYSWDYDEENKKLHKLLKSFIKVYNYYSLQDYEEINNEN